jgi:hypothetical protein
MSYKIRLNLCRDEGYLIYFKENGWSGSKKIFFFPNLDFSCRN